MINSVTSATRTVVVWMGLILSTMSEAFVVVLPPSHHLSKGERSIAKMAKDTIFSLNDDDDENDETKSEVTSLLESLETPKKVGDPLREKNGIRASLHPTTINAIAEALKARARQSLQTTPMKEDEILHFQISDTVEPLMVMVTAGQFASDAIQKRQESSTQTKDGMVMTQAEEQTVAGRVMGVIMRLDALEAELSERCASVEWVGQYDEWGNFGVLASEEDMKDVHQKIADDPLFCMNRAECLLAIFLQEVEIPQLEKVQESVPDDSKIDFLDQDRMEVVLGDQ